MFQLRKSIVNNMYPNRIWKFKLCKNFKFQLDSNAQTIWIHGQAKFKNYGNIMKIDVVVLKLDKNLK